MEIDTIELSGPMLYQKLLIQTTDIPMIVHMFGDHHKHEEKCKSINSILTTTLVKNTLLHSPYSQVLFEGQPRQKIRKENYLNDFHGNFVTERENCWHYGSCSSFTGV